ncbi:hypothetical protein SO802_026395 [Lithocarpus litseifolius]|uniref:Uncharacterized protein n=1 Tax=Lithocarpus litseifolius TaxID=425828 RepID=A0AAW2C4T8_9ROSI
MAELESGTACVKREYGDMREDHHLPQTTHIQLLQPKNGAPFAVGLIHHRFLNQNPPTELTVLYKPNPLLFSSTPLTHNTQTLILLKLPKNPRSKNSHHRPNFRVLAFANPNGSDGFSLLSLTRSVRCGLEQLWSKLGESRKKETGFCLEDANVKVGEFAWPAKEGVSKGQGELEWFRTKLVPKFVSWNQWERWKLGSFIARLIKLQEFLRLIVQMQRMLFTKQLSSKGTSY